MKIISYNSKNKITVAIAMTTALGAALQADDNEIKVYWKDTLRLESADGNNKLKFGGRIPLAECLLRR